MSYATEAVRLARRAKAAGLRVDRTRRGHWRARCPRTGRIVYWPGTPGGGRWRKNAIAELKRLGIHL